VARPNPLAAAGIGMASVFLVLGGTGAAVAFADPGGSRGSDRGNNSDRGDNGSDGWKGGGGERRDNGGPRTAGRQHADEAARAGSDAPRTRVGSGREDTARLSPGDAGPDPDSGGGSDSSRATSSFEPPRVTFGNGREPGVQSDDPEPRWRAPASPPAEAPPPPPPPAPAAPSPSLVDRIAPPPAVVRQFVVAPAAELTEPMWGIAGLLLIPAAGAALGYRQARAAQSVDRLRGS
jgi:hypothetical protein